MNVAGACVELAVRLGIDTCFANPGTTELHLVAALDGRSDIRTYLGLSEGVVTGAADGYARMRGTPALTLLHLGPGLANGIANLHNARRARSPVVNLVGEHATWHLAHDPPLAGDLAGMARAASDWVGTVDDAGAACAVLQAGFEAAVTARGVATIVFPADLQAAPAAPPPVPAVEESEPPVPEARWQEALDGLRRGKGAILAGGRLLHGEPLADLAGVAAHTGARLLCETFPARLARGVGRPAVERLPYFPEQAMSALEGLDLLVVAGTRPPVSFFGYPGVPSSLVPPGVQIIHIADDRLPADLAGSGASGGAAPEALPIDRSAGPLNPAGFGAAVAAVQPHGAIVVDEAATSGLPYFAVSAQSPPFDLLALTGGAIGMGLPVATGASIACPQRPVVALQADGSGAYTEQALWTMARYALDVTVVVASNQQYRILRIEAARAGIELGPVATDLTDISGLDWVALAEGHGVPAVAVDRVEDLADRLERALASPGPHLIEARLDV